MVQKTGLAQNRITADTYSPTRRGYLYEIWCAAPMHVAVFMNVLYVEGSIRCAICKGFLRVLVLDLQYRMA